MELDYIGDEDIYISTDRLKTLVDLYYSKRVHSGICCANEMIVNSFQCCIICDFYGICTLLGTLK